MSLSRDTRGLSPVISSILLCATVLAVGASVWAFSYSTGDALRENYSRELTPRIEGLREGFIIEKVSFNSTDNVMRVWVYNYGTIDVELAAVRISRKGSVIQSETLEESVPAEAVREFSFTAVVNAGEDLVIQAISTRGNMAFEAYRVP